MHWAMLVTFWLMGFAHAGVDPAQPCNDPRAELLPVEQVRDFAFAFDEGTSASAPEPKAKPARARRVSPDRTNGRWNAIYDRDITDAIDSYHVQTGALRGRRVAYQGRSVADILLHGKGPNGFPKDLGRVCPRFKSLNVDQRKQFWTHFFQATSWAESRFDKADHGDDGTSLGLLQVSLSDNRVHGCNFKDEIDVSWNSKKNLECGVRILADHLIMNRSLFTRYYWSVLDPSDLGFARWRNKWIQLTGHDPGEGRGHRARAVSGGNALSFCY